MIFSKKILCEFLKQNMASSAKSFSIKKSRNEKNMIEEVRHKIKVLETIEVVDQTPSIWQSIEDLKGFENLKIFYQKQSVVLY